MATIKAPFNFVPLSEKVFFPDWADEISHDIPFEDGESGTIELKITAETPIFVRNGNTRDKIDISFSNINGKYFIPATSIKGAIRNVLEIISFSKMSNIADTRYSLRDLQLKEYLNFFQNSDVHCGWMSQKEDKITINNHGIPKRISHADLDKLWETDFSETFKNATLLKTDAHRTALYKIQKAKGKTKTVRYDEFMMNSVNPVDKRIIAKISETGQNEGVIVLTGQPSARKDPNKKIGKKGSGKCYEFVFPTQCLGTVKTFDMDDELYKDFCFIYKDSEDWKFWKEQLKKGESIPVFFSLANNQLLHFGLSYLYKLPYKKRTKDCLPVNHRMEKLDLSECMFGCTLKNFTLKGRVQFSQAFLESGNMDEELQAYMGSPKSSYYPIYLKQEGNNGFMTKPFITMMSDKAQLKGWKRYPVRDELMPFSIPEGQESNATSFIPLRQGSVFKCKIRFHNLKKAELGALLKAIHFNPKGFHSLGFAKAHGYGKVKIESELFNCQFDKEDYISAFTSLIPDYSKSQELRELNLMSETQKLTTPLEYMELPDFVECKRQKRNSAGALEKTGEYLQYYSSIVKMEEPIAPVKELTAQITYNDRGLIKAKLIEGKDTVSKVLKDVDKKLKLKVGDNVLVKLSSKKDELIFIKNK